MDTRETHAQQEAALAEHPELKVSKGRGLILLVVAIMMLTIGGGSIIGGIVGATYTYRQAVAENITTPDDASIANTAVRGPFTMLAEKDIIIHHAETSTDGLRYAEMPRTVPQLDENGNPVLDENGDPVMVANTARDTWITATTLTTALGLGIMAYVLAAFAIVAGIALVGCGVAFLIIRRGSLLV